jgi:coiled-coil domain-containing protein 6
LTTPPSSMPFNSTALGMGYAPESRGLSYPSVPPPSLSSSFGSPTVPLLQIPNGNAREASLSPIEPLSRGNSNAGLNAGGSGGVARRGSVDRRIIESGNLRGGSGSGSGGGGRSRRGSFDVPIGGRVAESGTLLGRSRGGSLAHGAGGGVGQLPETVNEVEDSSSSPLPITMEFGEVSNGGNGTRMLDAGDLDIPSTKSR